MKIFALSGSLRAGSYNTKVIRLAVDEARRQGAEVTLGNFRDFAPPLYDADLEAAQGFPPQALALIGAIEQADAIMIASPEYNVSVPGPLKNALDWVSRAKPYRLKGKPLLLLGASSGLGGALKGLAALRDTLDYQGAVIHPDVFSLKNGKEAFDETGRFLDSSLHDTLARLISAFLISVKARLTVS